MTERDSPKNKQGWTRTGAIGEWLGPLAAVMPEPPNGRVRSLDEARRALRIPTSAADEILRAWGIPTDFELVVYPLAEPEHADLVAEFALLRVVVRDGRKLVAGGRHTRLRLKEKSNALWIVYGSIATATDGSLTLESLAIGPAFEGQLNRKGDDIAKGITGPLLRLLSPPRILAACAERLLIHRYRVDAAARPGDRSMSDRQRDLLDQIDQGRPPHAPVSDDQLADLSARYLTLYHRGIKQPRAQLAGEFGITAIQVRDRIHRARQRGFLTTGRRGRTGADPGPRLLERGWRPPDSPIQTLSR